MGNKDVLLLITIFVGFYADFDTVHADGNKEHVHIKVHVPEIIKKHTHVRTVYKHHYKSKPKHAEKSKTKYYKTPASNHNYYERQQHDYYGSERRDPTIRHGTLHSKFQKNQWMDHLIPAASHLHESTSESSSAASTSSSQLDPEILTRWQHNFHLLNRKPFALPTSSSSSSKHKNHKNPKPRPSIQPPSKIPAFTSEESTEPSTDIEPVDLKYFENFNGGLEHFFEEPPIFRVTGQNLHQLVPKEPKSLQQHGSQSQSNYDEHEQTYAPKLTKKPLYLTNHSPEHRSPPDRDSKSYQTEFKPPRSLKITEHDRPTKNTASTDNRQRNTGKTSNPSHQQPHRSTNPFVTRPDDGNAHVTLSWDAFDTDPPHAIQYPDYIHAVAEALQPNSQPQQLKLQNPYHQQQSSYLDNGGHQISYSLPRPTSLALMQDVLTAPPIPSQEEFLPVRSFHSSPLPITTNGKPLMQYQPVKEPSYGDGFAGDDLDVDYGGQQQQQNEREGDEEEEVVPLSFDEVPYQTFTKRKNLLRNAHRE